MNVLADTSVWVQHFRGGEPELARLLMDHRILMHPFVAGELACGNLKDRDLILHSFEKMPHAAFASHEEVHQLIEVRRLWGRGLGWVDAHLLASALLSNCRLWTLDLRLAKVGAELGCS